MPAILPWGNEREAIDIMLSICIFCGSSAGRNPAYKRAAVKLGQLLAEQKINLVYGGGNIGLMGEIAQSVIKAGGKAIGVIPQFLVEKELVYTNLTKIHVVDSMHERKAMMAEMADAFIAMPGGFGTLDEFFEALTLIQTFKIDKFPIILVGSEFWKGLIDWIKKTLVEFREIKIMIQKKWEPLSSHY